MTATAPSAESTQMAHTPDPRPDPPAAPEAAAEAGAGGRHWAILGDHPLLTLIATGIATLMATGAVALLIFSLTNIHDRIDRLEDTMLAGFAAQDAKIDELEDTMNARFSEQDAKVDELDAKIEEINLKLTALIVALNKTGEVDAAIEGRLLDSELDVGDPGAVLG